MQAHDVPLSCAVMCYIQLTILTVLGHIRNAFAKVFGSRYVTLAKRGYAPVLFPDEVFYIHRIFDRINDVFNCPIIGAPATKFEVADRMTPDGGQTYVRTGETRKCINLGSYNYLGFADDWMDTCGKHVIPAVDQYGVQAMGPGNEFGVTPVHRALEKEIAKMVGKPDALVYNMGFGTNSATIPALMGPGDLIVSDALNHSSIVNGARDSGAKIAVFRHVDLTDLEHVLRTKIAEGQPGKKQRTPWRKILIIVEGVYSMEGDIVDLRGVVNLAKKYKCYVYVDEAHSVGAMGEHGRGVCEYCGVDPSEVDILMGTFSKSFSGMGGYIAATPEILDRIRLGSAGKQYAPNLPPVVAQQILTATRIITGKDGSKIGATKLRAIHENSLYFRRRLQDMGCNVLGDGDSPVVPMMVYSMSKVAEFARECMKRGVAAVTVTYPATPLKLGRARFCISAAHTREDLDYVLKVVDEVADICHVRFNKRVTAA